MGRSKQAEDAWQQVGGLSRTSKMPCHSWGLPAQACKTGAELVDIEGSVCHDCYARHRAYTWPRVQHANERRLAHAMDPGWVAAMSTLVDWQAIRNRTPYFRWFDTGDLQSAGMLDRIAQVANETPRVRHWLPTKEAGFVSDYLLQERLPENLTIRLSARYVDEPAPQLEGLVTSTVHREQPPAGFACSAYERQPASCRSCRACWDPRVPNVSYPHH